MKVLFCVHSLLSQTSICWLKWIIAGFSVVGCIGCWIVSMCGFHNETELNGRWPVMRLLLYSQLLPFILLYVWLFYHFRGLGRWNWALWLRLVVVWLSAGRHLASNRRVKVWKAGRNEVICWTWWKIFLSVLNILKSSKIWVISGEFLLLTLLHVIIWMSWKAKRILNFENFIFLKTHLATCRSIKFTF